MSSAWGRQNLKGLEDIHMDVTQLAKWFWSLGKPFELNTQI